MIKKFKLLLLLIVLTTSVFGSSGFKKDSKDVDLERILGKMQKVSFLDKQLKNDKKAYVKGNSTPFTGTFYLMVGDYLEYTETYENGLLEGDKIWYDPNGNIMMIETYVNGKIQGEQVTYYPNTQLRSVITYSRNIISKVEWYSQKGQVLFKEIYKNGTGKWKHFYDDGSVHEEGQYVNGAREGIWKTYNEKGELERTVIYKNGGVIGKKWL